MIHCPYGPCQAIVGLTAYLDKPGDTTPSAHLIDPHPLDAEHRLSGEMCPTGLMRYPLTPAAAWILIRDRIAYLRRAAAADAKPAPAVQNGESVGEHSLTPHPTENSQWFVTGPERAAQAMATVEEIKTAIGSANMAMAEAQGLAFQAAGKVAEAEAILRSVSAQSGVQLGLVACTGATEALTSVQEELHGGIEENSRYMEAL